MLNYVPFLICIAYNSPKQFMVSILLDCREPKNLHTFCLYEYGVPHDDTQASYTVVAMSYNSFRIMQQYSVSVRSDVTGMMRIFHINMFFDIYDLQEISLKPSNSKFYVNILNSFGH